MEPIVQRCVGMDIGQITLKATLRVQGGPGRKTRREVRTLPDHHSRAARASGLAAGRASDPRGHGVDRGLLQAHLPSAGRGRGVWSADHSAPNT